MYLFIKRNSHTICKNLNENKLKLSNIIEYIIYIYNFKNYKSAITLNEYEKDKTILKHFIFTLLLLLFVYTIMLK